MSINGGPPAQPPQLSPDGNWVWDGTQWQPVTGSAAAPAHAGVFKAYDSIVVEPTAPTVEATPPAVQYEEQYPVPAPAIDYSYNNTQPDLTPLWQQTKGGGYGRYLYFGAALVLFLMVLIVLNSMSLVSLPFISAGSKASPNAVVVSPSPTPDTSGPDSVRADRFLNGQLKPALVPFDQSLTPLLRGCTGNASTACFDAITATDHEVKKVMVVIAAADIPRCIDVPTTRLKADFKGMDDQLQTALQGFPDNNKAEITAGGNGFSKYVNAATSDITATETAAKKCFTIVLPTWVPY